MNETQHNSLELSTMGTEPLLTVELPTPRCHARRRHFTFQHLVVAVISTAFSFYVLNHIRGHTAFRRHPPVLDTSLGPEDIWDSVSAASIIALNKLHHYHDISAQPNLSILYI